MNSFKTTNHPFTGGNVEVTADFTGIGTDPRIISQANASDDWIKWELEAITDTTTATKRYLGVGCYLGDECPIVKINTYYHTTNKVVVVGNTNTSTTIDNLTSTTGLVAGMLVEGVDIPDNTKIVSVDGLTSITIDRAATGTHIGVSLSFYTYIHNNKLVDLYDLQYDTSASVYGNTTIWLTIPDITDSVVVYIEHNATHNAACAGATFNLFIVKLLENSPISDGGVATLMTTWDSSYPTHTYTYTLVKDTITSLGKIEYYNGDDVTTDFTLSATNHAQEFMEFSIDGGTTWKLNTDALITWGSNTPTPDDEIINATTGNFSISFLEAPVTGVNNIAIKFLPMVTNYNLTRTMSQPYTTDFIDRQSEIRMLEDCIELIP